MATTADFKNGLHMRYNNDIFVLVQFQHVKPGKGGAFVRTKLKSLTTGRLIENTFTAGERIDLVHVQRRPYQYLFKDDYGYTFMHTETFEQVVIEEKTIDAPDLLKEGQEVEIVFNADTETPMSCELPDFVNMEVTYTEPGIRGDTSSTSSLKAATIETGANIQVPLFVNIGDRIKVDTRDHSYVERVK